MAATGPLGSTKHPLEMTINKRFFVSMLTRDIELEDAILDLLDNCLDGVIRSTSSAPNLKKPYRGHWAKITINANKFEIFDNCGGIPGPLIEAAFAIGRTPVANEHHKTIGVYGIGMKRAIFKMALEAKVESQSTYGFEVNIDEKWLTNEHNWRLAFKRTRTDFNQGTRITLTRLRPEISKRFSEAAFVAKLNEFISRQYAVILNKGFRVELNGTNIDPAPISILSMQFSDMVEGEPALTPYMLRFDTPKVKVSMWVGMYRSPPETESDEDNEAEQRQSSDNSGWTIICNDRAVVSNDTTITTGWGEAGVPRFHPQFIGIRGIVEMESEYPLELPLTTTKRGLDASSVLFLTLKDYMREGIKTFTSFTNHWKAERSGARKLFERASLLELTELRALRNAASMSPVQKLPGAQRYKPFLPSPQPSEFKRISFLKHKTAIAQVARSLLDDPSAKPSDVGIACFDEAYKKAGRQ